MATVQPAVLAGRVRAVLGVDARTALAGANVPLLYVQARRDRLVLARSLEQIASVRPDLQHTVLDTAHLVLQLDGAAAARAVAAFAESVHPSQARA